jgi:2'-5' RNA ligase
MFGIAISASSDGRPFWRQVDKASRFENAPSIRALGYPPHITLVRYLEVSPDMLFDATKEFEGEKAFSITFDRMDVFDADPIGLWLSPRRDQRLVDLHAKLHEVINPELCDPHYRLGQWMPHLTIAMSIPGALRSQALELAAEQVEPFSLTFDAADCVSWPPVRVLHTFPLRC